MNTPKVLFFCKNLNGGGAERSAIEVISHIDQSRYDVKLLLGDRSGAYLSAVDDSILLDETYATERRGAYAKVRSLAHRVASTQRLPKLADLYAKERKRASRSNAADFHRSTGLPLSDEGLAVSERLLTSRPLQRLKTAIQSYRPDILVTTLMESGAAVAFASRLKLRPGCFPHKWITIEQNNTHGRARQYYPDAGICAYWNEFTRIAYSQADAIIAVSKGVKRGLVQHYGCDESKIDVIVNPVRRHEVAAAKPVQQKKPFILAAGRLHPQKQLSHAIRAFASISESTDADLVIIGEGEERQQLQQLAAELNVGHRVLLPGYSSEIWGYMKSAECFLLSSQYEGFPLVLVEAMAAGCPVVSYDCDFGPGEIIENDVNGLLVPHGQIEELSRAMLRVLDNPDVAARFRKAGMDTIERFDSRCIAQDYEKLFADVLRQ